MDEFYERRSMIEAEDRRDDMIQKARFTLTLQEQESYDANNSQKPFSPKTFLA